MSYHVDPNRKPDSPLALKAMWTDNCTYPRQTTKKPSEFTIIPHCIAGNPTAEAQAAADIRTAEKIRDQALSEASDAREEMKNKGYFVPDGRTKVALTKIIRKKFGF